MSAEFIDSFDVSAEEKQTVAPSQAIFTSSSVSPELNAQPSELVDSSRILGTVLAVQANFYWVQLDQTQPPDRPSSTFLTATSQSPIPTTHLLCTRRTRLKKIGQQVMVGDRVEIEDPDWAGGRGAIAQVFPRKTQLDRPPIANVDQILLVFALAEPMLDPCQLSRFLVKAESTGLAICLCLSKRDLVPLEDAQQWCDRLRTWGYEPLLISLLDETGLETVPARLNQQTTVVSGPSGVGKSSLINRLIPKADLRVGAVSGKLGRGRHTTRHVELFQLPTGGLLADTPGFNQPDLDCAPAELAYYFPEARQRLATARCQFGDCLHRDEPNCAVRGDWERYDYYLMFLDEVLVRQEAIDQTRDAESTTKVKIRGDGQLQTEPKLATKKYRRPSRRKQKQQLQDLYSEINNEMDTDEEDIDEDRLS
ncbi:small ribosomal subunit biogenesis GTPase RsgA [Thermocoleostomius sinensis]|uniref:Small ribosomal subunit biogenesis GTPase RsgA n=1 Tax=Thermocoleostomius sinensis A174 TaxID=2016057 RepID=A0A9E8ZAT7_9CYAN|nr:small ribosomal subunit biogenesis GTPase RsgA [Thermocoleostomius sinensis]WAL59436.1 small ribosomal subunit biogenesis GTPase RsgA [Thermocoleostomius sinensis A174]